MVNILQIMACVTGVYAKQRSKREVYSAFSVSSISDLFIYISKLTINELKSENEFKML